MNLKKSTLLALLALTVPHASQARSAPTAAVDACVKSFVEAYLPNNPLKQVRKLIPAASPIDAYYAPRKYTVALSAYGVRSGDLLAQARCVASNKGVVLVLDNPPAGEYVARADFVVSLR
jgi:hypothetical protein